MMFTEKVTNLDPISVDALVAYFRWGNTTQVKMILAQGVNPNQEDKFGELALHVAAREKNIEIVQLLLEAGATCAPSLDKRYFTPLHMAIEYDRSKIAILLITKESINTFGFYGHTPLLRAVVKQQADVVKALLAAGANVNLVKNRKDRTALHCAAYQGKDAEGIAKMLLAAGANANLPDVRDKTALQIGQEAGLSWALQFKAERRAAFTAPAEPASPLGDFFKSPIYDPNLTRTILGHAGLMGTKEDKPMSVEEGMPVDEERRGIQPK